MEHQLFEIFTILKSKISQEIELWGIPETLRKEIRNILSKSKNLFDMNRDLSLLNYFNDFGYFGIFVNAFVASLFDIIESRDVVLIIKALQILNLPAVIKHTKLSEDSIILIREAIQRIKKQIKTCDDIEIWDRIAKNFENYVTRTAGEHALVEQHLQVFLPARRVIEEPLRSEMDRTLLRIAQETRPPSTVPIEITRFPAIRQLQATGPVLALPAPPITEQTIIQFNEANRSAILNAFDWIGNFGWDDLARALPAVLLTFLIEGPLKGHTGNDLTLIIQRMIVLYYGLVGSRKDKSKPLTDDDFNTYKNRVEHEVLNGIYKEKHAGMDDNPPEPIIQQEPRVHINVPEPPNIEGPKQLIQLVQYAGHIAKIPLIIGGVGIATTLTGSGLYNWYTDRGQKIQSAINRTWNYWFVGQEEEDEHKAPQDTAENITISLIVLGLIVVAGIAVSKYKN